MDRQGEGEKIRFHIEIPAGLPARLELKNGSALHTETLPNGGNRSILL